MPKSAQKPTAKNAQTIEAEHHEPTFFAMIPKMAIMDLDPYELALYCNYKQTVGENGGARVTKTNATIARETKMSVNRMKAARDALESKHYIYVQEHPDADGNINQPPTIIVRDIWSINHQIYSTSLCEGVSNGDTPPPPFVTPPLSRGDTKEEPNKNNQKEEEKTPPSEKPTGGKHEPNPMYDAVFDIFKLTAGMNTDLCKMLEGKATKKGYVEFNLSEPIDAAGLREWGDWYRRTELGGDPNLTMVKRRDKIQSSIGYWQQKKREKEARRAAAQAASEANDESFARSQRRAEPELTDPPVTPLPEDRKAAAETIIRNTAAMWGVNRAQSA